MSNLHFDVCYYDSEHKKALQNVACVLSTDSLVQQGLDIDRDEFFTYMLFREQRMYVPGWQTYAELRARVPTRYQQVIDNLDLSGGTVRSVFAGAGTQDNAMVEGAGVGAGLALAGAMFGLHEADWEKIPIRSMPSTDFQIASEGDRYIQVECKGSVVSDSLVSSSISNAKKSIEDKKRTVRPLCKNDVLLGVIAAFPTPAKTNALLRLLDPIPSDIQMPARKYKTLARMSYYGRLARAVSDSKFVAAVRSRIQAINATNDWTNLSGLRLEKNSGEPYEFSASEIIGRTFIPEIGAVGRLYVVGNSVLFDGVLLDSLNVLAKQDFGALNDYVAEQRKESVVISGYLQKNMCKSADIPEAALEPIRGTSLFHVRVKALVSVWSSGRVSGFAQWGLSLYNESRLASAQLAVQK